MFKNTVQVNNSDYLYINKDVYGTQFIYVDLENTNNTYQDPIFYNDKGNNGKNIIAKVDSLNRSVAYVDRAADYKIAIESFSFPQSSVPFFILNNNSVNGENYNRFIITASLTIGNTTYGPFNDYIFSNSTSTIFTISDYYPIINEINRIFSKLQSEIVSEYNSINGAGSYEANTELPQLTPFLIYDPSTDLFSYYADVYQAENYTSINYPIDWIFSNNLFQLFMGCNFSDYSTLPSLSNNNFSDLKKLKWDIENEDLNTVYLPPGTTNNKYVRNTSVVKTGGAWSKFTKLIIISNFMPLRKTNTNSELNYDISSSNIGQYVQNNTILTYTLSSSGIYNSNLRYEYNAVYPRWGDLYDQGPLNRIDFTFGISDVYGNFYPLYLNSGEKLYIRAVIARKLFA